MNTREDYIAVFDSGLGGLSVLRHLRRVLPEERFLYYGDSAHAPYGTRCREEVEQLTFAVVEKLLPRGLKALVVACNTATSAAIHDLRQAYPDLIVVGIEPALKMAADHFPGGRIGVMATEMTLREEKFAHLLAQYADRCRVWPIPAPRIVELVEQGLADSPQMDGEIRSLFAHCPPLDAVVLGCTHFPFAEHSLRRVLGDGVCLLDGGDGTARETRRRLEAVGLLRQGKGTLELENSLPELDVLERTWQLLNEG